ncbi:MAG: hypothetical protein ABW068_03200 [Candidatus Thiodiazotropha sp.]
MSRPNVPTLLVPRTCTKQDEQNAERKSHPLTDFRGTSAYILLGNPGAGKTESFKHEAIATGGHYVRARDFAALDPRPELSGKTLFIDGLDEMRASGGDGRTPLDHVRRHLVRLGRPRFRLSCREADWYGDSDRAALKEVTPGDSLTVLHLDPLNDADIHLLLERKFAIADANEFIKQANRHGLADLQRNPQTLGLLAKAVGSGPWPDSRTATYDLACRQLVHETNPEHRAAKRSSAPTHDALLDASGFLCAVQLLAGIAGFALDDDTADDQHILWRELSAPRQLPYLDALSSGLFQSDDREQQRIPIHRSIAEFLGARYLAQLIDQQGLPLGRIVALLAVEDGGIAPDLRGLTAWLAAHCRSARAELIERDPLGVVLYGDVRNFTPEDKHRVLASLRDEAERYADFCFEDWTAAPFGALATPDMTPRFLEMLASPSRTEPDIALLDCVLDALRYGPPPSKLTTTDTQHRLDMLLDAMVHDASYPQHIRHKALVILLRDLPHNAARLISLSREVQAGTVLDEDDQLLGRLLTELFPEFIRAEEIFDFLHREKQDHLIGNYHLFWSTHLPKKVPDDLLPVLLDQLTKRAALLRESLTHLRAEQMAGDLLARGLETHGDTIDDARLYEWLGTALDKHGYPHIEDKHQRHVATWLTVRPKLYKAVLLEGAQRCIGNREISHCLSKSRFRLYDAIPPSDITPWCLDLAAKETLSELKRHFFDQAVRYLIRQSGHKCLTLTDLDYLDPWMQKHPEFEPYLESYTSCPLDHWLKENAARDLEWNKKRAQRKEDSRNHFHKHIDAIRAGNAHPAILHDLALAYLNLYTDIDGETPTERLADFLDGDKELIEAAHTGFRRSLDRDDLPSVTEIIKLESNGHMHFIRQPCLVGIAELYNSDPEAALQLNEEVLRKLTAFRLTWGVEIEGEWFSALIKMHPDLVTKVFVAYALSLLRKGREHIYGIWDLAYNEDFAAVARIALPDLLKAFPLRAKVKLLSNILNPLLKAGLRYLDVSTLASIITERLAMNSMSAAQRVFWLTCGLMISPGDYEKALAAHIGNSKALRNHLGAFLHDRERRRDFNTTLPESSQALLIELLAPDSPPERPTGAHWVSPAMQTAMKVRDFIDALGGNPNKVAGQQLERLLSLPQMAPWHGRLRHAIHTQRIARRKASIRHLDASEICRTLANQQPANAADLAALTYEHLRDLTRKIRNSSTNDYRQYWSYDTSGKPERPKPENDCRDILLSDLRERMGRLDVDAIKEGFYAEEKRADIRVSAGGTQGFNIPIEIKRDSHRDLWRAIREQLIERYTRDPGSDGFGIYLVFWFGGEEMPLQEGKKPRNAADLELRLRSTLTKEEARHIAIVVIDCERH